MNVLKSLSKRGNSPDPSKTGRRSFMWKMGAAASAALATAASSISSPGTGQNADSGAEVNRLSHRLGTLEDENAIRSLHQTYESRLDNGQYDEAVDLFAEDGEVVFNGGVFQGKDRGIARLYCDCFRSGLTGRRIGPAPVFDAAVEPQKETIEVAADRLSAEARFPYVVQVGTPIESDSSLVHLARLHGGGVLKWCEAGVYQASYVKDPEKGSWKIKRLEYRVLAKTDYRPGRTYAQPVSVPLFTRTYPEDPSGPDRLIS